jgi:hypothetical protein
MRSTKKGAEGDAGSTIVLLVFKKKISTKQ